MKKALLRKFQGVEIPLHFGPGPGGIGAVRWKRLTSPDPCPSPTDDIKDIMERWFIGFENFFRGCTDLEKKIG